MSENLQKIGIVAVFLLVFGLMWILVSDSEKDGEGNAFNPLRFLNAQKTEIPSFEFDALTDPGEFEESILPEPASMSRSEGPGSIIGHVEMTTSWTPVSDDLLVTLHLITDEAR